MKKSLISRALFSIAVLALFFPAARARAHCDGMDGPVVKAAREALAAGNVDLVLPWVSAGDESALREVFSSVMAVRKLSPAAASLADQYFFETVVRVHRAGEGFPFTGLKPAGRDLGPAIPAADHAVESDSLGPVLDLIMGAASKGMRERFREVMAAKKHAQGDVAAGREYVKAYVRFVHYVEGVYAAARSPGHSEIHESDAPAARSSH